MNTRHTPGPWEASFHQTAVGTPFGIVTGSQSQDGRMDVVICHGPRAIDEPSSFKAFESNARLIAASPALLDLCRRALRALDEDSYPQLRDDLREAIDKAEAA